MRREGISAQRVRELLDYNPLTGVFTRKVSTGGRYGSAIGSVAGMLSRESGYILISLESLQYRAHRLAWLYMTGVWPSGDIDHMDGARANNKWANLRDVDKTVNAQNKRKAQSNSKTGLLGACWATRDRTYIARIKVDGKYKTLGYFETAEEAHGAYVTAKRQLHFGCTI